jgi:hypothetical protein
VGNSPVKIGIGKTRVEIWRPIKISDCSLIISNIRTNNTPTEIGIGVVLLDLDGLVEVGYCRLFITI